VNLPTEGERILYSTKSARNGTLTLEMRRGTVLAIWDNGWDGPHISTTTGHCIPSLGDTWTSLEDECALTPNPD